MAARETHIVSAWEVVEYIRHYFINANVNTWSNFKFQQCIDCMLRRLLLKDLACSSTVNLLLSEFFDKDVCDEVIERTHDLLLTIFKDYLIFDGSVESIVIIELETRPDFDVVLHVLRKEVIAMELDQFASHDNGDYIPQRLR